MKYSHTIVLLGFLLFGQFAKAQEDLVFMTNSKSIDDKRYEDIKYSPYFFEDWVKGNLVDEKGNPVKGVTLNYNGYSHNIEIKKGDKFIELDAKYYQKVEVLVSENADVEKISDGEKVLFKDKMHERFRNRMVQVIYEGENITFLNDFSIVLSEKELNNVGSKIEFKQFVKRNTYYFLKDGNLKNVKLSKRKFVEALGAEKGTLDKFIKKERINFTSHADLKKLVAFYDGLSKN